MARVHAYVRLCVPVRVGARVYVCVSELRSVGVLRAYMRGTCTLRIKARQGGVPPNVWMRAGRSQQRGAGQ